MLSGPDISELKNVRDALRKCIRLARMLYHEKEYFKFIRPSLDDPSNEEIEIERGSDEDEDNLKSRYSVNNISVNSWFDPYLFDKLMERQSLIFEHFTLAYP